MYGVPVEAIVKDMAAMNGIRQGEIQRLASEGHDRGSGGGGIPKQI